MLLKISKFFLYASVFSVVIVLTSTFFPFIGGKYYFFRALIELALIFYLLFWAFEASPGEVENRFKTSTRSPLFIAVSLFVLFFLLASLLAHDPQAAFWSNYERGDGGFQMIHYYLFFVLLTLTLKNHSDWMKLFKFSVGAAVLVILYGLFAQLGWSDRFISPYRENVPEGFWAKLVTARFQGSLGNPSYVAPYLMFSIFYAAYLWLKKTWAKRSLQNLSFGLLILVFLFFFSLTQTKGAFIGIVFAVLAFFIYLSVEQKTRKLSLIVLASLFVLGSVLVSFRHSDFAQKLPGSRFLQVFDLVLGADDSDSARDHSFNTRLWTWNSALKGFKERPLLGWGPENFSTVFDRHFDPRHFVPGTNSETWFDRAHSVFFDYLASTGLLGLLSYLSIFVIFFLKFFTLSRKTGLPNSPPDKASSLGQENFLRNPFLRAAVFAIPIGYLGQGLALFDVLPIYLNLFLFLAFANFFLYELKDSPSTA